jgi:hypothetical protein
MAWFKRRTAQRRQGAKRQHGKPGSSRSIDDAVVSYLTEFVQTHRGVEAYVEPVTSTSETTLLLVAHDGRSTRRPVPSAKWAYAFAEHLQIPGYDAAVVGYPERMREYNRKVREESGQR